MTAPHAGAMRARSDAVAIDDVHASAYVIPTDGVESDGTLVWDRTTLVLVEIHAGSRCGLGYTYSAVAAAQLVRETLAPIILRQDALAVSAHWHAMRVAVRNLGRCGVAACAIAAVDAALWDLKAKLLGLPLSVLLGQVRASVPVYGSGGFTSYTERQLKQQLQAWRDLGIERFKVKVGRQPAEDGDRLAQARAAIGTNAALFVDANGAYTRKQALAFADLFAEFGVTWFEEPVSSDDLAGLRLLRDRAPGGMDIAAGEYGYDLVDFQRMLDAQAVDVLQIDATRCGISGFLQAANLCAARSLPLSAHTAPSLHLPVCCALVQAQHIEYFHDHARIEHLLFDGAATPAQGALRPDLSRPGLGLDFKAADVAAYAV